MNTSVKISDEAYLRVKKSKGFTTIDETLLAVCDKCKQTYFGHDGTSFCSNCLGARLGKRRFPMLNLTRKYSINYMKIPDVAKRSHRTLSWAVNEFLLLQKEGIADGRIAKRVTVRIDERFAKADPEEIKAIIFDFKDDIMVTKYQRKRRTTKTLSLTPSELMEYQRISRITWISDYVNGILDKHGIRNLKAKEIKSIWP